MANEYYERLSEMNPGELADGLAMEAELDAIAQGFAKLPNPHTGGQGFDGPVRVGDAVNDDEAINKSQLDAALGTAKQLTVAGYGDFNATAWATIPSGTYLLFGTGSQITNSPFTLAAAKTYYFAVRHAIGDNLYFDAVVMSSLDDSAHVDIGREAWRAGPDLVSSAWRAAALKTGALAPLEGLTPAADKIAVFNGPTGAELITLTAFMRTLLDDASLTDAQKTLKLPTAGGFGFRNKLINGDFRITQRGTSGTIAAGQTVYTVDRWIVETYGSSVAWGVDSYTTAYPDFYLIGASGNTSIGLSQRIEAANCTNLPGNKVTISFRLYGNSVAGSGGVVVTPYLYAAGSTDNFSAPTFVEAFPAVNVIEGIKSVVATSAVLPASVAKGLQLQFEIRGLDAASKLVAFLDVQLEIGEVATPFEHRPYQTELALCHRYFVNKRTTYVGAMPVNNGVFAFVCEHPVSMRTTPTLIWTEGYNAGGASFVETANLSVHSSRILYRNASGVAPGSVDIDGSLLCTAEL